MGNFEKVKHSPLFNSLLWGLIFARRGRLISLMEALKRLRASERKEGVQLSNQSFT